MAQNSIDVRYVAGLARLHLSEEECAEFQPQLDAILGHAESLLALDVSGIDATAHPVPVHDVLRQDIPHQSLPVESVLNNAPEQAQGQIRVPKVIADA
jgi:aspartyl-tRNA(Asn)/glutamyl-tRNA(Gln) amidotransferase subunit C